MLRRLLRNLLPLGYHLHAWTYGMRQFRPRISLRWFMAAFTAIAVGLGFYIGSAQQQRRAVAAIERLGGTVIYDYQYLYDSQSDERMISLFQAPPNTWYVRLLGRDYFHRVVGVYGCQEQHYGSNGSSVFHSFGPSRIKTEFHNHTDNALVSLRGIRSLDFLNLAETSVTDAGLERLACLGSLDRLDLYDCDFTDKGLKAIADINGLSSITLFRTKVTEEGLRKLQASLPGLQIWHYSTTEARDGEFVLKSL